MKKTWWCVIGTDEQGRPQPEQVVIDRVEVRPLVPDHRVLRAVAADELADTPQGALDAAVVMGEAILQRERERLARLEQEVAAAIKARDAFVKLGDG